MITILYPYRNRELQRIKISLDSLHCQVNTDFKVVFINYGSDEEITGQVQSLLDNYDFVIYTESYTSHQPWSRAKAINIGLQKVDTEFVFVADIDMIFRSDFTTILHKLKNKNQSVFFKVGFLSESETKLNKDFNDYIVQFYSGHGAQGLSLFSMKQLIDVNGFDEFFHFWGAEDEDIHNRLQLAGFETIFYEQEILMLHRWHSTYRASEKKNLTKDFQLSNIVRINQKHQIFNKTKKIQKANHEKWGTPLKEVEFNELENWTNSEQLLNIKSDIDHFLFYELPNFNKGILNIIIKKDKFNKTIKYKLKKILGKEVPSYYSLKEINDKLLLHIISFYHQTPYYYKVSDDLKSITFKIKK